MLDLSFNRLEPETLPFLFNMLERHPLIDMNLDSNNFSFMQDRPPLLAKLERLRCVSLGLHCTFVYRTAYSRRYVVCSWVKEGRVTVASSFSHRQTEIMVMEKLASITANL